MKNSYVNFISDEHLLKCVANLYKAYAKAKNNITKKNFYSNKVDTIKLTFDAKFNDIDEESLIQAEILRQIDKSINNSIGTFHEQILGGIAGFEVGSLSGFDIEATDNTLFAFFEYMPMSNKLHHAFFEYLARQANSFKKAKIYWVCFDSEDSFKEIWHGQTGELTFSHKSVYKISIDQFYALLSGQEDALFQLYKALPIAIQDYLNSIEQNQVEITNSALAEIKL